MNAGIDGCDGPAGSRLAVWTKFWTKRVRARHFGQKRDPSNGRGITLTLAMKLKNN
jgi:hypothetical protein